MSIRYNETGEFIMRGKGRRSPKMKSVPLQDLKKALELKHSRDEKKAGKSPETSPVQTLDDDAVFLEAMKDVQEIKEFREIPVTAGRQPFRPLSRRPGSFDRTAECLNDIIAGRQRIELTYTQEYVQWKHPGCTEEIVRKLRTGKYAVQEFLDLHGLTIEEAESEVDSFIRSSLRKGLRCVKIIHGRGLRSPNGPVLKNALIFWLTRRYRKNVLSFVTARQCDGGLGAMYILLKQR
jgi:DNA-nicking Smr family endonuclease